MVLLVVVAAVPQMFTTYDPVQINPGIRLEGPSHAHVFGTDHLGRDLFARVVFGTRTSLGTSALVVLFAALIGVTVGSLAGYGGGLVDEALMRVVDLSLAFPLLVLAMAIVAALGPGLRNAMLALIFVWWSQYARLARGLVLQVREREFVTAARALGASGVTILYRHILPNCFPPLLVKATLDIAVAVLVTASLSFLGLGVLPPDPDWGGMVSNGRTFILDAWWYPTFPGLAIFVTVMALNLVGDTIRDILDPRIRE
ncbi:MAG: ABC transporter permease [Armatimonadetes bacterium]|nr:ABC transporter permease [Armatimonadota bacterium]